MQLSQLHFISHLPLLLSAIISMPIFNSPPLCRPRILSHIQRKKRQTLNSSLCPRGCQSTHSPHHKVLINQITSTTLLTSVFAEIWNVAESIRGGSGGIGTDWCGREGADGGSCGRECARGTAQECAGCE